VWVLYRALYVSSNSVALASSQNVKVRRPGFVNVGCMTTCNHYLCYEQNTGKTQTV